MAGAVLALNAGSSSIKFALFRLVPTGAPALACKGEVDGIGTAPRFRARDPAGLVLAERSWPAGAGRTHEELLGVLLDFAEQHLGSDVLAGIGHRIVHGGEAFYRPVRLTPAVLAVLETLVPLAPLHQPHNLAPVRVLAASHPDLPQVACFDTGFHHTMPPLATRFALPRALHDQGVRRYGFHGLSYEFIAGALRARLPALAAGRVVAAHLGNGASLCAMADGRSVDTTMGFTALEGLMMGTRCGAIDPGVLLYLQQQRGMTAQAVEDLLYHRSGLLGVSGLSNDMRTLLASDDPHAAEAVALFAYRIARETAALAGTLGGLDGFVFTAGIGEHAPPVRAAVCARLGWLGVELDPAANARGEGRISTAASRVAVHVIPTDEEAMIARHTEATLDG